MAKRKGKGKGRKAKTRRVPLRMQPKVYPGGDKGWAAEYMRADRSSVNVHPVVHLGEDEIGYGMDPYRLDDCFQAAIATATQIPIEQVPDLRLDKRVQAGEDPDEIDQEAWARIERWARDRGLRLVFHESVPVARHRWIGAAHDPWAEVPFGDHCLVMCHDELIFDPVCSVKLQPGHRWMEFTPSQISYGITFDREEQ